MLKPLVTVILATFNRKAYLREAIESVLKQTYAHFELIIIDDGSTDDTAKMVKMFTDPRIEYHFQENQGRSIARNLGLSLAKGEFVTFIDSDDLYLIHKLEQQVDYLQNHPQIGMIYTSAYSINDYGQMQKHQFKAKVSGWIYHDIAFFVPVTITLPTVMIRRDILKTVGGFDELMARFEDTDLWRRISKITPIGALPNFTCKIRTHSENRLASQDPNIIIKALHDYSLKIQKEDGAYLSKQNHGLSRLYLYYANAMSRVPYMRTFAKDLFKIAFQYNSLSRLSRPAISAYLRGI